MQNQTIFKNVTKEALKAYAKYLNDTDFKIKNYPIDPQIVFKFYSQIFQEQFDQFSDTEYEAFNYFSEKEYLKDVNAFFSHKQLQIYQVDDDWFYKMQHLYEETIGQDFSNLIQNIIQPDIDDVHTPYYDGQIYVLLPPLENQSKHKIKQILNQAIFNGDFNSTRAIDWVESNITHEPII